MHDKFEEMSSDLGDVKRTPSSGGRVTDPEVVLLVVSTYFGHGVKSNCELPNQKLSKPFDMPVEVVLSVKRSRRLKMVARRSRVVSE